MTGREDGHTADNNQNAANKLTRVNTKTPQLIVFTSELTIRTSWDFELEIHKLNISFIRIHSERHDTSLTEYRFLHSLWSDNPGALPSFNVVRPSLYILRSS